MWRRNVVRNSPLNVRSSDKKGKQNMGIGLDFMVWLRHKHVVLSISNLSRFAYKRILFVNARHNQYVYHMEAWKCWRHSKSMNLCILSLRDGHACSGVSADTQISSGVCWDASYSASCYRPIASISASQQFWELVSLNLFKPSQVGFMRSFMLSSYFYSPYFLELWATFTCTLQNMQII